MQGTVSHLYILLAITFAVVSQLIIKWKMSDFSFNEHQTILDKFLFTFSMLFNPYIFVALILTLLAQLSWMIAMTKFDISYAYPFTTLGFVFVFLFSVFIFKEPATKQKIVGLLFIIIGIIITSKSI